eukprot:g10116.t1
MGKTQGAETSVNRERYHAASPAFDWSKVAGSCVKDVFLDRARELDQSSGCATPTTCLHNCVSSSVHTIHTIVRSGSVVFAVKYASHVLANLRQQLCIQWPTMVHTIVTSSPVISEIRQPRACTIVSAAVHNGPHSSQVKLGHFCTIVSASLSTMVHTIVKSSSVIFAVKYTNYVLAQLFCPQLSTPWFGQSIRQPRACIIASAAVHNGPVRPVIFCGKIRQPRACAMASAALLTMFHTVVMSSSSHVCGEIRQPRACTIAPATVHTMAHTSQAKLSHFCGESGGCTVKVARIQEIRVKIHRRGNMKYCNFFFESSHTLRWLVSPDTIYLNIYENLTDFAVGWVVKKNSIFFSKA